MFIGLTDRLHWHETDSALEPTQLFPEHSRSRNLMQFEPQIDQEFHSDHIPGTLTNVIRGYSRSFLGHYLNLPHDSAEQIFVSIALSDEQPSDRPITPSIHSLKRLEKPPSHVTEHEVHSDQSGERYA